MKINCKLRLTFRILSKNNMRKNCYVNIENTGSIKSLMKAVKK